MAYATTGDIEARMTRTMSDSELNVCETLLEDAALLIDAYNSEAPSEAKLAVSCRMVIRAIGDGTDNIPVGASQGSMLALGYSQSWTVGSSGSVGELYISKADKKLLGYGDRIGFCNPLEELTCEETL